MEQDDAWNTKINSDIKLNYVCKTEVEYLTGQYYQPILAFHIFISIALYIVQYALTFINNAEKRRLGSSEFSGKFTVSVLWYHFRQ